MKARASMQWTVGTCFHRGCVMTLVAPAGAGQSICWLHALMLGLPIATADVEKMIPVLAGRKEAGR